MNDETETPYERTDDGSPEGHITAEVNVAGDSKMVELDNLGDLLEALLELLDLQTPRSLIKSSP